MGKRILSLVMLVLPLLMAGQNIAPEFFRPDAEKIAKYQIYLITHRGGPELFEDWKASNTLKYHKELWYFTESFSIKRDHLKEGVELNEEIIDVVRFEHLRQAHESRIVVLPGFKDALVLLPASELLYKPDYIK